MYRFVGNDFACFLLSSFHSFSTMSITQKLSSTRPLFIDIYHVISTRTNYFSVEIYLICDGGSIMKMSCNVSASMKIGSEEEN